MIAVGTVFLNAINSDTTKFFGLLEILTPTPIRLTSAERDLVFQGNNYSSQNGIVGISPPNENSLTDRSLFTITLADNNQQYEAQLFNSGVGTRINIWLGVYQNEVPVLSEENVIMIYSGFRDSFLVNDDDGQRLVELSCSNPMQSLETVNSVFTSKDYAKSINPSDTSYDHVSTIDKNIEIKWGKA
jgi:hypothetical protein